MSRKQIRMVPSVYRRCELELELQRRAACILREVLGDEVILRWMMGDSKPPGPMELLVREHNPGLAEEEIGYIDSSRINGVVGAATVESRILLGDLSMIMDAEIVWIAGAWEEGSRTVATDSQAEIQRCRNLVSGAQSGRSWINELIFEASGWKIGGGENPKVGKGTQPGRRKRESRFEGPRCGLEWIVVLVTQPSHTGRYQTSLHPIWPPSTHEME